MPANSVRLVFTTAAFDEGQDGPRERTIEKVIYVSPRRARELRRRNLATVVSFRPFVLRLNGTDVSDFEHHEWSRLSDGVMRMNGALLERRPPTA
jgi:hypothetical protein